MTDFRANLHLVRSRAEVQAGNLHVRALAHEIYRYGQVNVFARHRKHGDIDIGLGLGHNAVERQPVRAEFQFRVNVVRIAVQLELLFGAYYIYFIEC